MWRVVLDNAALTSALLNPHGPAARLLDYAHDGRLRLFATERMLSFEGRILRESAMTSRHQLTGKDVASIVKDLPVLLCLVQGAERRRWVRGGMEAEVLRCASVSNADFVVTTLKLSASEALQGGTQIVKAGQLVRLIGRES